MHAGTPSPHCLFVFRQFRVETVYKINLRCIKAIRENHFNMLILQKSADECTLKRRGEERGEQSRGEERGEQGRAGERRWLRAQHSDSCVLMFHLHFPPLFSPDNVQLPPHIWLHTHRVAPSMLVHSGSLNHACLTLTAKHLHLFI